MGEYLPIIAVVGVLVTGGFVISWVRGRSKDKAS